MSIDAVEAVRAERQRALELFDSLSAAEWAAPSACAGWRVQDVACHMASTFHTIVDPSGVEQGTSDDAEQNAEVPVQARRDWSIDQVLDEYRTWSDACLETFAAMQQPPLRDQVIPLGNLGSHPIRLLTNAIAFDHYCHLRHDIGAAVPRAAELPQDGLVLAATLEWMLAGLPQMCATALAGAPAQAVNLELAGPGGGEWVLAPGRDGWTVTPGSDATAPTAHGDPHSFVAWATMRASWRDHVRLDGADDDTRTAAAAVLDVVNVI